jgi:hypothetical protein
LQLKKVTVLVACQEYILDNQATGARFDQCLQGFRARKKPSIMEGGVFVLCAKMWKQS